MMDIWTPHSSDMLYYLYETIYETSGDFLWNVFLRSRFFIMWFFCNSLKTCEVIVFRHGNSIVKYITISCRQCEVVVISHVSSCVITPKYSSKTKKILRLKSIKIKLNFLSINILCEHVFFGNFDSQMVKSGCKSSRHKDIFLYLYDQYKCLS